MREDCHLMFCCRRGCKSKNGIYGIDLGIYKNMKRPEGIIPINVSKLKSILNTKTTIKEVEPVQQEKKTTNTFKGKHCSAKRTCMKTRKVLIPSFLRIK